MSEMENPARSDDRYMVVDELTRGCVFAHQLRQLLSQSRPHTAAVQLDLAVKIMTSFSRTLLLLQRHHPYTEVVSVVAPMQVPKSEDSQESCKSTFRVKDRRGCYKRRRTSQTWERDTTAPAEDGHAWRKYGQKVIMNAKYPRSYFRCTHKEEDGCLATKQVQQVQDSPPLYRTTYHGHHTCKSLLKPQPLISDDPPSSAGLLVSFQKHAMTDKQEHTSFLASFRSSLKSGGEQEENSNTHTTKLHQNQSSFSSDYLLSPPHQTVMSDFMAEHADDLDVLQKYFVFDGTTPTATHA